MTATDNGQATTPGYDLATVTLNPEDLRGQIELAKTLAPAALLPQALRGKPADVLVTVLYGRELGLSPMQAIQGIYVVNGRPSVAGRTLLAKVRQAGHRVEVSGDDKTGRCTITRHDDPEHPHTEEFTWADAERAKLTGKDTWKYYPKKMLRWRAISNCVDFVCPEVALGFEVAELVMEESAAERPTLAQVAAERQQPAEATPAGTEPVDAELVDDDAVRAQVESLHAAATGEDPPRVDADGFPEPPPDWEPDPYGDQAGAR
jgi:hypothetical protein